MKNLLISIFVLMFVSCQQNTSKKPNVSVSNEPLTVKFKDNENSNLTILKLVKNNRYNENGYVLLMDEEDEYGYTQWGKWGPVFKFDPSVVTELKRYKTVEDFWYSDFGGGIIDQIVSCNKNRVEVCSIK